MTSSPPPETAWMTLRRGHRAGRQLRLPRRARCAVSAALVAALAWGCADDDSQGDGVAEHSLLVMAAASLSEAMPVIARDFEMRTGVGVDLVQGATHTLAAQIQHGAPADVFFAADEATIDRLVANGSIRGASVRRYVTGRLTLVWRAGVAPPAGLADLAAPRYAVVAIANPEVAPYGAAAREALRRAGVWEVLQPRIIQGENVSQAYQFVRTGNADVALVARSVVDTVASGFGIVDPALYGPIHQSAGIVGTSEHPAAQSFLDHVLSAEGQEILAAHGFAPVSQ